MKPTQGRAATDLKFFSLRKHHFQTADSILRELQLSFFTKYHAFSHTILISELFWFYHYKAAKYLIIVLSKRYPLQ